MTASTSCAAQYVRMSTDKQDLSPAVQKEAIAEYAAARGMEVVASYEDEGRSGVHLKNRPGLMRLLRDVTEAGRFSTVLVYDVSRWGRFQDSDAAAYYEYHCRLHGADVIYVAETFGAEVNPITALLKSMKRAMAAEYSRDLAKKCRAGQHLVVSRGYQMGALPCLGYRRCSVSADGERRTMLEHGQRKLAATDRVEWVLASSEEVELVKRICDLYARIGLTVSDIARLGSAEGWRNHQGHPLSRSGIASLLRNEALIGNFVWGRRKLAKSIVTSPPSRYDGSVPRLIDDTTWAAIERRRALEAREKQTPEEISANLKAALLRNPMLVTRELPIHGLPNIRTIRKNAGAWASCLKVAGMDLAQLNKQVAARGIQRRQDGRDLGVALAQRLREDGHSASFDGKQHVLVFPGLRMRPRLLWPTAGPVGPAWRIRVEVISHDIDFDLLVRMEDRFVPKDFFVASPADVVIRFPLWLNERVPTELTRFWYQSPRQLLERIREITNRSSA